MGHRRELELEQGHATFTNIAHGFKSGGWNTGGFVVIPEQISPFENETIDTFEIGIKTMLLQNRMRFDATAFYYDYQDLQAFTQANVDGLPLSGLTNAWGADIYGWEAEQEIRKDMHSQKTILLMRDHANHIAVDFTQLGGYVIRLELALKISKF